MNSIDYGVWLLYNRVDASYQRVERVAKLLLRLQFVRNLLAQSVNLYFERIDRYEIIKVCTGRNIYMRLLTHL